MVAQPFGPNEADAVDGFVEAMDKETEHEVGSLITREVGSTWLFEVSIAMLMTEGVLGRRPFWSTSRTSLGLAVLG